MFMGNHIVPKKEGGEERGNYRVMCAAAAFLTSRTRLTCENTVPDKNNNVLEEK